MGRKKKSDSKNTKTDSIASFTMKSSQSKIYTNDIRNDETAYSLLKRTRKNNKKVNTKRKTKTKNFDLMNTTDLNKTKKKKDFIKVVILSILTAIVLLSIVPGITGVNTTMTKYEPLIPLYSVTYDNLTEEIRNFTFCSKVIFDK